jgi:hypothetical protein
MAFAQICCDAVLCKNHFNTTIGDALIKLKAKTYDPRTLELKDRILEHENPKHYLNLEP